MLAMELEAAEVEVYYLQQALLEVADAHKGL